jgi:EthD domain
MEKITVALWKPSPTLFATLPAALAKLGATRIRINVPDEAVATGAALIQRWQDPQQDAVVQFWLSSANPIFTGPAFEVVAAHCARFAAWLVAESTVIPNTAHPPAPEKRSWGWSQASFISFRSDLAKEDAIAIWHDHHTKVAIETQSNFEYVQNLIVMPLTEDAPDYDAFVEECFPLAALTDPFEFFDAVGDQEKFDRNLGAMMESCNRFIEFGRIDIMPTSQYDFGHHDI